MEALRRLPRGKTLVQTQLDHLTVGVREKRNYLLQQAKKLCFLGESFGSSAWILHFEEGNFAVPKALAANIFGGVGDDPAHPGASLWTIEAGMVDSLHDFDPTDLEGVFSEAVVPRNPLGEGKEALGTALDPSFFVPIQQGTFPSDSFEIGAGQNAQNSISIFLHNLPWQGPFRF